MPDAKRSDRNLLGKRFGTSLNYRNKQKIRITIFASNENDMNKKTATEMLAQIGNDFFKGVDLAEASLLKGDERRAFRLTQVERLLTEQYDSSPLAI